MKLEAKLDPTEARVFGVLIEKALTTPDQYPLSVNAATNGANQKSNRDPVLSLSEDDVRAALDRLERRYLARKVFPGNSRVEKFGHNAKDALGLDPRQQAVVAELLVRGPQTPGELRSRAGRMTPFGSLADVMATLAELLERETVQRLPPAPGGRSERYAQLLCPDLHPSAAAAEPRTDGGTPATASAPDIAARIDALESTVAHLERQVELLAARVGVPLDH